MLAQVEHDPDQPRQLELVAPAVASLRWISLARDPSEPPEGPDIALPPLPGDVNVLAELSLLPFRLPLLEALPEGVPTFYIGWQGLDSNTIDWEASGFVAAGELLGTSTGLGYIGVSFQDGLVRAPWDWAARIARALAEIGDPDAPRWDEVVTLFDDVSSAYRLLDAAGEPARGAVVEVRAIGDTAMRTVTLGDDADVEAAVKASISPTATVLPLPGQTQHELRVRPSATTLGLHVDAVSGISTEPGGWLRVPGAAAPRGFAQVTDLDGWVAEQEPGSSLARFHVRSRLEPLIDGREWLRRIARDLRAVADVPGVAGDGYGVVLTGWTFDDFELVPGEADTLLSGLLERIRDNQRTFRILATKLFQVNDPDAFVQARVALTVQALATGVLAAGTTIRNPSKAGEWTVVGLAGTAVLVLGLAALLDADAGIGRFERSFEFMRDVGPLLPGAALWSRYPATTDDNPIANLPGPLTDLVNTFGNWHQKTQVIRRPADGFEPNEHIAYLGGLDLQSGRVAAAGHQTSEPWHDVQARITGPAAADVFRNAAERYEEETSTLPLGIAVPTATALAANEPQGANHIVQIARTVFRPADSARAISFAPNGEKIFIDTLVKAVGNARRYIHIEDQYFTPNDSAELAQGDTLVDALIAAAPRCERLLVITPWISDQPFGFDRRRAIAARLRHAWGSRFLIGGPLRRHSLQDSGNIAARGRCTLLAVEPGGTLLVTPRSRAPRGPGATIWINGELMLLHEASDGPTVATTRLRVLRGTDPSARFGATPRRLQPFSAVTYADVPGIFVHAKVTLVDDVFAAIASQNANRRGAFHDGEIGAFVIPQALRFAADNPAFVLRTSLWAEHLGLPISMGPALLGDSLAGFELFRRHRYGGNRFVPFDHIGTEPLLAVNPAQSGLAKALVGAGVVLTELWKRAAWNSAVDPTTSADPAADADPFWGGP